MSDSTCISLEILDERPLPSDWTERKLGQVVEFLDSQRVPLKEEHRAQRKGIYPYYGASGIIDYVDDYIFDEELVLLGEDGANIITRSSPLAFKASGRYWVNNHAHVMRPSAQVNIDYLVAYLESLDYSKFNTGTAQPKLNREVCSSINILIPPRSEQNKIAEILTCWDKAIELVERLIEEKRVRKIALTLKLITGRLRLPKHVKDPSYATTRYGAFPQDWKALKVKDVAEESKLRFDADNNTTVLSCTKHKGLVPSLEYFGKQIFSNDLSNYKVVTLNQFAYATNHIEEGSIGLLTAIKRGLVSPIYTVFQTDTDVDPCFLFAVFKTSLYLHIFQSATSASVDRRGSLRWSEFKEIPLWLPSLPEQRDISQLIALLGAELESLQQYASGLTDQKRGLMQKLLTGKIRVKV